MAPFSFDSNGIQTPRQAARPDRADIAPAQGGAGHSLTQSHNHSHLIEVLAKELGRSVLEIKPIYDEILAQMAEHARVRDFLPILVPKRVRNFFASDAKRRGFVFY